MASAEVDVPALYWGSIDSNVEWCEPNYVVPWAAEIVNSVTSVPISYFAVVGLLCLPAVRQLNSHHKYSVALLSLATVGIGSFLFHLTLRRVAQSLDELPMIYTGMAFLFNSATMPSKGTASSLSSSSSALLICASLSRSLSRLGVDTSAESVFAILLALCCVLMTFFYFFGAAFFLVFALLFSVGVVSVAVIAFTQLFPRESSALSHSCGRAAAERKRRYSGEKMNGHNGHSGSQLEKSDGGLLSYSPYPLAAALYKWSFVLYFGGFAVWIFENRFCQSLPVWLYLHGLWHILAGLGTYTMVQCQLSYHCEMLQLDHTLKWHGTLLLPYIHVHSSANGSGSGSGSAASNGTMEKWKAHNGEAACII